MKTIMRLSTLCLFISLSLSTSAQKPDQLRKIIKPNAEVEKIASGFAFTEGPAPDKKGQVYFTDQPNNKIYLERK